MKKLFTILAAVLLTATVWAQSPEKMSYQAVIRDTSNNLVTNQAVGMRVSILQGSATGTEVYKEIYNPNPMTNANGLVSIEIGSGIPLTGTFATIDWANGLYFIKTETDPAGGTNYTITGTSQLLSVPYALHAKTAETVTGGITETDPVYTGSQAANINATDITNLSNLSGVNSGDQDISGIATNQQAIQDTASQIRTDIPDVSGFLSSETDPVYAGSQAANITATDITNLSNLSCVNSGDQDISGIAVNTQAIKDTAAQIRADIPDVSGFITTEIDPSVPTGTQTGDMQYWDGTAWVNIDPPSSSGYTLYFINNTPQWGPIVTATDVMNSTTGKVWMDRNLGASQVATSSTDADSYGDLYQWGRGADGHQIRTSDTTSTLATSDTPGHGNFITNGSSPYDWRNPQNDDLWQGVSGTNNPCPSGYRLPTEAELEAERGSWSSNDAAGAFASPLKLPVAGYRYYSNGTLDSSDSYGYYWSSTVDGIYARNPYFDSSDAHMYSSNRAFGFSVRCIKD